MGQTQAGEIGMATLVSVHVYWFTPFGSLVLHLHCKALSPLSQIVMPKAYFCYYLSKDDVFKIYGITIIEIIVINLPKC